MKGKVKAKVLTSGRLNSQVRANRVTIKPGLLRPEQAYALYSTDSEKQQVATLHQGLDRCAALLRDLLHAEHPGGSPAGTGKPAAPHTSQARKGAKKLPAVTAQRGAASSTRTRSHAASAARAKLPPPFRGQPGPQRRLLDPLRGPPESLRGPPTPPHSSVLFSVHQSSSEYRCSPEAPPTSQLLEEEEEADLVPVRDSDSTMVRNSGRLMKDGVATRNCVMMKDGMTMGGGGMMKDGVMTSNGGMFKDGAAMMDGTDTLHGLLRELRDLMTDHNSAAELLLRRLELVLSSGLQGNDTPLSLQSENIQLCRRILNERLQPLAEAGSPPNPCTSLTKSPVMQEDNLEELWKALRDTQNRLGDIEVQNAGLQAALEDARRRLQDEELQKSRLEEDLRNTKRLLQQSCSSGCPAEAKYSGLDPSAPSADLITHYLGSLSLTDPVATGSAQGLSTHPYPPCGFPVPRAPPPPPPLDGCNWSESSFNTRDEAAFRDGLAALDASIASLQRSIQLDLKR